MVFQNGTEAWSCRFKWAQPNTSGPKRWTTDDPSRDAYSAEVCCSRCARRIATRDRSQKRSRR